uniref:Sushi domain-containing protein n=1 Tax=Tetradesmus obliquus TaxID=3088 RepID=A0A383VQS1_TETOB|eukprot:jgi/Sobl393_1/13524/SZX67199.1
MDAAVPRCYYLFRKLYVKSKRLKLDRSCYCSFCQSLPSWRFLSGYRRGSQTPASGINFHMKLLAVLLLCGAALAAAQVVPQAIDPAGTGGSCFQPPTCETPPGTDGWQECTYVYSGTTVRVCTAVCNKPYFTPQPNDPTVLCTNPGGWQTPVGSCVPTPSNCVNTEPPKNTPTTSSIGSWDCKTLTGGDYAKQCTGTCLSGYAPLQNEDPAAHCDRYTGKWQVTGGCVEKACTSIPDLANPTGSIGWDASRCESVAGVYVCTAPCRDGYRPSPSVPKSSCSPDTGDWSAVTGSCQKVVECGSMPPPDSNPPPTNSNGWDSSNCQTIGTDLVCTTTCKSGYSGDPTASCDKTTGTWSPTTGRCSRTTNKCSSMPPPGTQTPQNSFGFTQAGCALMSPTSFECVAECKPGYFGEPTISCNPATGFWGSVTGTCRGSSSGCTGTPVSSSGNPLPDPSGSVGWNVQFCFTSSGLYTCQAPCEPGYEPEGSIPFSVCTSPPGSSTASWSAVKGSCRKVQVSCSTTPPYSAPSNSIGWQQQYCREVNQQYTCTAYCSTGYRQGSDGLPSASCDIMTGQWTAVGGSCVPDNGGNSCSALPPIDPPKNSLGWRKQACYTTGFGPRATTTCYATCVNGCSGSGSNGYDPYTVCSWATGEWSEVNGFCIPDDKGACSSGYPTVPEPDNSCGWSCSTMGWGPYVQRVCTASCKPGYYGFPCAPSITCTGSGSWSGVKGACVPYEKPAQPCWGYPGGKPTCHGGKAKWSSGCGGGGYCYKSRTYAKNCGSRCNLYCPSHVKHGTRCTAPCSGGASGSFKATCINGQWSTIGGGCRYR